MPLPTQNLNNDLISWNCSVSMTGAYGGDVAFTNQVQQYSVTDLYREFSVSLETAIVSDLADDTCFAGTVSWLVGVIHAVEDLRNISDDLIKFKIRSYFAFLAKKPLNSEFFDDTADNILTTLITDYGGVPAGLTDFTGITLPIAIYASIAGNNFLDEMKKIAEASESTLFVNRSGILVAEDWKDDNSSVDTVIPDEAVKLAKRNRSTATGPSVVTVRGRFVSQFDCGSQVLSSADFNNPNSPNTSKPFNKQGARKVCGNEGIAKNKTRTKASNLAGSKITQKNATVEVTGDGEIDYIGDISGGTVVNPGWYTMQGTSGGQIAQGATEYQIVIKGKQKPGNEKTSAGGIMQALAGENSQQGRRLGRMPSNLTGLPMADLGKFMNMWSVNNDKLADAPEPIRMEIIQADSDLISEFGTVYNQVDNLYVSDYETLFDIAVRRFQQYKINRRTWEVNILYLACLGVNDVVTFTTPDTNETVTGVIMSMKVSYTGAGPSADMSLTIGSFEDIGATSYTSANLFRYAGLCGTNANDWVASNSGDAFILMHGGYVQLGSLTSGTATLTQTFSMEIGASYSLVYNLVKDAGSDMVVKILDSGTHATKSSSATANDITLNFTPNEVVNTIEFETTGNWYLARPRLFKTVTK